MDLENRMVMDSEWADDPWDNCSVDMPNDDDQNYDEDIDYPEE